MVLVANIYWEMFYERNKEIWLFNIINMVIHLLKKENLYIFMYCDQRQYLIYLWLWPNSSPLPKYTPKHNYT